MTFAQHFLNIKCHQRDYKPRNAYKILQRVFIQQEIMFKTLEIEKVREQLNKMKDDLRTVVSFFHWCILLIHLQKAILKLSKE